MEDVVGGILGIIGRVTSASFGAGYRALEGYDGRRVRWATVAAASVAATLCVPMLVGACFAVRVSWQIFNDDFLWIASLFIGGFAILVALLFLALPQARWGSASRLVRGCS